MIVIPLTLYIVIVFLGGVGLALERIPRLQHEIPKATVIAPALARIFDFCNMPLAIVTVACCAFSIFVNNAGLAGLICCGIFAVIAFIVTHAGIRQDFNTPAIPYENEYKADLDYIATYNELQKLHKNILENISAFEKSLTDHATKTTAALAFADENINNYIELQKAECEQLIIGKNKCNSITDELTNSLSNVTQSFDEFIGKLAYSNAALEYFGESERLLADINVSFKDSFHQNRLLDSEFMQKTERVLSVLHTLTLKCAELQSFPKPYTDTIAVYSSKMEAALEVIKSVHLESAETP
ncbi:MAG: hypothetical protein Ta2A_18290 [Treponemataceae bacterium]|nr:MAG: hypothetical protein Ta2A_18290 [Treponemataceae bacterium]